MPRQRLFVRGIVQGVGFRPFVYGLATRLGLTGLVGNNSSGVFVEVQGPADTLADFTRELRASAPPLAVIESISAADLPARAETGFTIVESEAQPDAGTPISPDIATCGECLRELFDPDDRRFRYPFINCTNCGPRFTIIQDVPYDRRFTTMRDFPMCAQCDAEYHDPTNRRFHAQPNACHECGPQVWFQRGADECRREDAVRAVIRALEEGAIVAIKGIGGFHLACDAANDAAVRTLRERKGRAEKPFALMARDVDVVRRYAHMSGDEARLLASRERPIMLLRAMEATELSPAIAPGNNFLGFLLPYTPLHHLIVGDRPLVMTSGNRSDEPIAWDNAAAWSRLAALADAFLFHDRAIHVPCDDSVIRIFGGHELPIRRSRGYSPMPVWLTSAGLSVLAVGGELKSTFCLTRGDHAYVSQHLGDMENLETLEAFQHACTHFRNLFRTEPERVVCDLHPTYLSSQWASRYAEQRDVPLLRVQHHHAHIASVMAEHRLDGSQPVIGVAFDGTGYGPDGAIWGGEVLRADYAGFQRLSHLRYVPLPGGDSSIKRPYRMALAHLWAAGLSWEPDLPCVGACSDGERRVLMRQLETGLHCVATSSMGRFFDAIAALIGIREEVTYEAQAAIEMEALCADSETDGAYQFALEGSAFDATPVFQQAVEDIRRRVPRAVIASRAHQAVASLIEQLCETARHQTGLTTVALSGGVFQNTLLLSAASTRLAEARFTVLTHHLVPPNDGGLALGQAAVGRTCSA